MKPSRAARPPIPPNQRHVDRKNDYQRVPKHRNQEHDMTEIEAIEAIESGTASHETVAEAVQVLLDSGALWHLQGSYGRLAYRLIEAGDCSMARREEA